MRAFNAQFEHFNVAHVSGWGLGRRNASGFGTARLVETRRRRMKCKNSGNEAKEYLKTKDIVFLNATNYAHFACRFAQIGG